jgi:hypothetical protein
MWILSSDGDFFQGVLWCRLWSFRAFTDSLDREERMAPPGKKVSIWSDKGRRRYVANRARSRVALLIFIWWLVRHAIQNASISRKHLVIEVSSVKPGDGVRSSTYRPNRVLFKLTVKKSRLHTKSELTVSDQGTKCGTTVDGEQIKRKSKTLSGNEHTIRLGKYQHAFRYEIPLELNDRSPETRL